MGLLITDRLDFQNQDKIVKMITYLPYFIVSYWSLGIILGDTDFYNAKFMILDFLDTLIVSICVFHFILNMGMYNRHRTILVFTIIQISLMCGLRDTVDQYIYWCLYLTVLFSGCCLALFTKLLTPKE